ncbi:Gfo/Idh/MocA family protein [candidate division KSB1 bacterium]
MKNRSVNSKDYIKTEISRRTFISRSAAAFAGISIIPRFVLGGKGYIPPSEKVNIACIGVGSQGMRVMYNFLKIPDSNIISVCDVNTGCDDYMEWGKQELIRKARKLLEDDSWGKLADGALAGLYPAQDVVQRYYAKQRGKASFNGCSTYIDYLELLEKEKNIDAVIVGTPDHAHTVISVAAMKAGKHVYCQKPMTHTVYEARKMAETARETGVATQVATGNSASEATRLLCEWIWGGAIGQVREVHNWSTRPFWPQGIEKPIEEEEIPDYLNWDLWLGPAPVRPYHSAYEPFIWRGWFDFGTGAIGDMGCYSFDTIFRVLKLKAPSKIETSSTQSYPESYPAASIIHFSFAAREGMVPVTVHWYDGMLKPQKPEELGDEELDKEGLLFVGSEGKILCGFNGRNPRLIPESAMNAFEPPEKTLPRAIGHNEEWIAACKGGEKAAANFEFAGPVTEAILLGNVAHRAGNKTIKWDSKNMTVTNHKDADKFLHFDYRDGWSL